MSSAFHKAEGLKRDVNQRQIEKLRSFLKAIFTSGIHFTELEAQLLFRGMSQTKAVLQNEERQLGKLLIKAIRIRLKAKKPGLFMNIILARFSPEKWALMNKNREEMEAILLHFEQQYGPNDSDENDPGLVRKGKS